mmetsp:Transcript_37480/g.87406  ORF Transcript_37480/g.87406 Transcript_37480/m.87406 type:complete len:200 (+) Transcript_37480:299-898(+)
MPCCHITSVFFWHNAHYWQTISCCRKVTRILCHRLRRKCLACRLTTRICYSCDLFWPDGFFSRSFNYHHSRIGKSSTVCCPIRARIDLWITASVEKNSLCQRIRGPTRGWNESAVVLDAVHCNPSIISRGIAAHQSRKLCPWPARKEKGVTWNNRYRFIIERSFFQPSSNYFSRRWITGWFHHLSPDYFGTGSFHHGLT